MTASMIARVGAAQATLDAFQGRAFAWGEADCARLAAFALRRLGYKPNLSRFGPYRSELGARRALKREGFAGTEDWLDSIAGLDRVPAAFALPGDVVGLPGEGGWTALTVAMGNGRLLGFHRAAQGCAVVQPNVEPIACWGAPPCRL